jgi:serine/threonine protein phosphatase PrpC/CRP-like cAMP-binding protein
MQIKFWAATDTGLTRKHNEDNFLVDRKLNLFIVADGMGGHAAGEVASSVAVHEVRKVLTEERAVIDNYAFSGSVLRRQPVLSLLERAISQACSQVYRFAQEDSERHGMGTTLSLLLIINGRGFVGHVGDSRIYMTRDGQARLVTEDHSVINELIKSGRLTPEEAHNSPYKNAVTRAVGVHATVEVDTFDFEIKPGDNFLLCSDGLSGYLEHEDEIKPFLAEEDIKAIPQKLIDFANNAGGKDNITAIIVRMTGEQTHAPLFDPPSLPLSTSTGFPAQGSSPTHQTLNPPTTPPPLHPELIEEAHTTSPSLKGSLKGLKPASAPSEQGAPPSQQRDLSQLPLDMLKLSPLFAYLELDAIEEVAHHAHIKRVPPHQTISLEGDEDEALIAILSGEVRLERGPEQVGLLSPGDTLGEDRLLARAPNEVSAITQTHTLLLSWDRAALYHLMTLNPAFGLRLMWGAAQVTYMRLSHLKGRLEGAKAALEAEVVKEPSLAPLVGLISMSDITASAQPARAHRSLTPSFIVNLDQPPLPLFKTPLSEAEAPDSLDALEAEQELFTRKELERHALSEESEG